MSRYQNTVQTPFTPEQLHPAIEQFMQNEGFKPYPRKGEALYKKGGAFVSPQILKVTVYQGQVTVEAFLKYALLPGVYVGEMDLNGFYGVAIKSILASRVVKLEKMIMGIPG